MVEPAVEPEPETSSAQAEPDAQASSSEKGSSMDSGDGDAFVDVDTSAVQRACPCVLAFQAEGGESYPELSNSYEEGPPFCFEFPSYARREGWPNPLMVEFADKAVVLTKAAMMGDRETFAEAEAMGDPLTCRELGRRVKSFDQELWDRHLHEVAFEVARQKFDASLGLQQRLLSTDGDILAAAGADDLIWGVGLESDDERVQDPSLWRGQNVLGLALMRARSRLQGLDCSLEAAVAAVRCWSSAECHDQGPPCHAPERAPPPTEPLPAESWPRSAVRALGRHASRGRERLACAALGGNNERRRSELFAGAFADDSGADGNGVAGTAGSDCAWQIVDREGTVLAEDDGSLPLTTGSVEAKMEMLLSWMLAPAVHGIPKLGVPSAADRAGELLSGRDVEAAVCEVVSGSERTVSAMVLNFCLERIPVLGCPTVLLRSTWGNLRSILIIAALYGHDLEAPRTLHEALLCLVPPGEDPEAAAMRSRSLKEGPAQAALVAETAEKVARMLIRGALKKATGLQAAVDCFELASLLYSTCGHDAFDDEDGFVHVTATPASAAREFFRRRSLTSTALLWCSFPLLVLGVASPCLLALLRWAPLVLRPVRSFGHWARQQPLESLPPLALLLAGLFLALRACLRIAGPGAAVACRRRARRCLHRMMRGPKADMLRDAWPRIVTTAVFALHGLLPACSTYSALSMILGALEGHRPIEDEAGDDWDMLHRLACATLGVYSFLSAALRRQQGEDEGAIVGRLPLRLATAAAKGCCVLAAWAYASLALDLGLTHALAWLGRSPQEGMTALGVVQPVAQMLGAQNGGRASPGSPFQSSRAAAFCLYMISVGSQQRLSELLGRREVLLRLIGAEHVTASTLVLLLRGVAVACAKGANISVADFLNRAAPPPACCVVIVALRTRAMLVGAALVAAPRVASGELVGSGASFVLGLLAGAYAAHALLWVWYSNREDMDSPALRLAMLVPGSVSGHAKVVLRGALAGARTRAVQMMAMGILERFARWFWGPKP